MNAKTKRNGLWAAALVLIILAFVTGRWTGGGDHESEAKPGGGDEAEASSGGETTWTCSMHPEIRQPEPGSCPLCGMALIPASSDDDHDDDSELPRLSVSPRSAALMNVQTWPARRKKVDVEKPMLGRVLYDESRTYDIVVRSDSYIERLFTNFQGVPVRRGDHLADVYSPDIYAASEELLSASRRSEQAGGDVMLQDARQKLRLLGVSEREIERIEESGETSRTFSIYSPHDGVINEIGGHQGHWLQTGDHLVEIVDTSSMWVWLDVFEQDLPSIRYGQPVRFTTRSLPGKEFTGSVAFIPPGIDRAARAFRVRLNVKNSDGALRDGMFVKAMLETSIDAGGEAVPPDLEGKWISPMHPEIVKDEAGDCDVCGMDLVPADELGLVAGDYEPPLVIPVSAPLITGRRAVVYVKVPDTERPTFELRKVDLGPRAGDYYVIFSGLEEGDQVVTHGNFKIDSELQLRGRPSMMAPEGEPSPEADAGHDHAGDMEALDYRETPVRADFAADVSSAFGDELRPMVRGYLSMVEGLAADDFDGTVEGLSVLHEGLLEIGMHRLDGDAHMAWMEHYETLHDLSHRMEEEDDLEGMRSHLQQLTREIETVLLSFGGDEYASLGRMYCPMAHDDRGATWLQDEAEINNPYFGAAMLRCGENLGELSNGDK